MKTLSTIIVLIVASFFIYNATSKILICNKAMENSYKLCAKNNWACKNYTPKQLTLNECVDSTIHFENNIF